MATILNITDRLKNDKKQIAIGDKVLTVNTAFDSMVEIEAINRSEIADTEKMQKTLKILLEDDYKTLETLKLDVGDMKVVFTAIMALVNACTYEEMEARFQELE